MSHKRRSRVAVKRQARAPVFAALGDEMRLALVTKLCRRQPYSISQLTHGSKLTRQAVTKHLRVLENAGLVSSTRSGRETRFTFRPDAIVEVKSYLDHVSIQWDNALSRLRAFVER